MKTFKEARKETKPVEAKYMTWNNKLALASEGTMSMGLFDKDPEKAKDAARRLVMFLRANKKVLIIHGEDGESDHKDLEAYTKELQGYVFDDEMLDQLDPNNKRTNGKRANDIVTARLRKLGVKIR